MDHLRDMDGMWQSQVVVPKALRPIIGRANFIQAVGIKNTGPMSRKKAAASAIHLAFVADAKTKIVNARAQLTRQQPWGRFVDVSITTMTAVDPDGPFTVPDGARLVSRNGQQFLIEYRTLPQPVDVADVVECEAVISQWAKKGKEGDGLPGSQAITAMRTEWMGF